MNFHFLYVLEHKTSKKMSVCMSVCLAVRTYIRTWILTVDTITFEGVSGSKQNLVGVFYVWNVGLVLKSKVKSWSWSWTGFWISQKFCRATSNLVGIFSIQSITFFNELHGEILILVIFLFLILKKNSKKSVRNKTKIHEYHWTYKT